MIYQQAAQGKAARHNFIQSPDVAIYVMNLIVLVGLDPSLSHQSRECEQYDHRDRQEVTRGYYEVT